MKFDLNSELADEVTKYNLIDAYKMNWADLEDLNRQMKYGPGLSDYEDDDYMYCVNLLSALDTTIAYFTSEGKDWKKTYLVD